MKMTDITREENIDYLKMTMSWMIQPTQNVGLLYFEYLMIQKT
jgi:hypothetical protein